MKANVFKIARILLAVLLLAPLVSLAAENEPPPLIKGAESMGTGLLLQPPLDLSKFTTTDFFAAISTIGTNKILKPWTTPIVALPPHARKNVHGLTEEEVKAYMVLAGRLFDEGKATPVSDTGLIGTQEDVVRRPSLNHVSGFSNDVVRVYLLVQRTIIDQGWAYFSILQDVTTEPAVDYFAEVNKTVVTFEGINCYKCHSSGPLAIHPTRVDLVSDAPLAAAFNRHIAKQPTSRVHFPEREKKPDYGAPLDLDFCTKCHDTDGVRSPLYKVHSHPIRMLVDFGYMPPKRRLTTNEIAQLKAWLDKKP